MDNNNQTPNQIVNEVPQTPPTPPAPQPEKKIGPIVGVLIIVLVLVVAALYFFAQKLNTESAPLQTPVATESPITSGSAGQNMVASASSADDIADMQADLNSQLKDVDYSF